MKASQDFIEGDYVKKEGNLYYPMTVCYVKNGTTYLNCNEKLEGVVRKRCKKGENVELMPLVEITEDPWK